MSQRPGLDTQSSASRQHFIDTGEYLHVGESLSAGAPSPVDAPPVVPHVRPESPHVAGGSKPFGPSNRCALCNDATAEHACELCDIALCTDCGWNDGENDERLCDPCYDDYHAACCACWETLDFDSARKILTRWANAPVTYSVTYLGTLRGLYHSEKTLSGWWEIAQTWPVVVRPVTRRMPAQRVEALAS